MMADLLLLSWFIVMAALLMFSLLEEMMAGILLLTMVTTILGVYLIFTSEQLSYTCKYCWQQVKDCDYVHHIGRICPEFPIECVFECGEYITRKKMKQHCKYQCINAKQVLSQEEYKFVVNCFARQESD